MKNKDVVCNMLTTEEGFDIIKVELYIGEKAMPIHMLLDTGTSKSLLISNLIRRESHLISFRFCHEGEIFSHEFKAVEASKIPLLKSYQISGILGSDFFLKNQFVIDFGKNNISQEVVHNTERSSFFYPIRLSDNAIKVPIVGIRSDSDTFAFLVDSGSNFNIISSDLVRTRKLSLNVNPELIDIKCLDSQTYGYSIETTVNLASLKSGILKYIPYSIPAAVTDTEKFTHNLFKSKILKGVLGNRFLHENQWIIDFKRSIIYSSD